jgi:hypothetical protein
VLSGILSTATAPGQVEDVKRAFGVLELHGVREMGEWAAISWTTRPRSAE